MESDLSVIFFFTGYWLKDSFCDGFSSNDDFDDVKFLIS